MNYREFGEAYSSHLRHLTVAYPGEDNHFDMELVTEFDTARTWNTRLGKIVLDHLLDMPKDSSGLSDTIDEYVEWAGEWAPRMWDRVLERCQTGGAAPRYITDLTFHLAAPVFANHWRALGKNVAEIDDAALASTQTRLALIGSKIMDERIKIRDALSSEPEATIDKSRSIYSRLVGQSTDFDVQVASVEASRLFSDTQKIVIPAPRQFELLSGGINVDVLILDTDQNDVRGIQAKTRLKIKDFKKDYDYRFVSIVDGFGDLGNKRFEQTEKRVNVVSEPGLLSMRHIARTPSRHIPLSEGFTNRDRENLKKKANEMTGGTRYTIERAGRIIGERLYGQTAQRTESQH